MLSTLHFVKEEALSLGNAWVAHSVTLIVTFRLFGLHWLQCFWHRSPQQVPTSLDGAVIFSFLIARCLGGGVGVMGRIEQHVGCSSSPSSAGNVPAGNSHICLVSICRCCLYHCSIRRWQSLGAPWHVSITKVRFWQLRLSAAPWAGSCLSTQWS